MTQDFSHDTVLLHETVDAVFNGEGVYVDGTFGRGGHSRLLLSRLNAGSSLIVFDKDPEAIACANEFAQQDSRVQVIQSGFTDMGTVLTERGLAGQVAGIMLDLGVSSPQLDDATRGFSFKADGPLDMRMNPESGESAKDWLSHVSEKELADVLFKFGDERFSRRIARAIVHTREKTPIETTKQLAEIIKTAHPKWDHKKHPATKSFQAIRIFINGELDELERVLEGSISLLRSSGRLAVISFHSLEDRAVKQFIRLQAKGPELPPGLPIADADITRTMKAIGKAIKPSSGEVAGNVRSRSAVLRVAQRL